MDIGLDVEAYKDYVNNVKMFAKFNNDYEILAKDNMKAVSETLNGPLSTMTRNQINNQYNEDEIEIQKSRTRVAA